MTDKDPSEPIVSEVVAELGVEVPESLAVEVLRLEIQSQYGVDPSTRLKRIQALVEASVNAEESLSDRRSDNAD